MKNILYCLTALLGVAMLAPANNNPTKISAKEIELVSGDGKHTLTLAAHDTGVGLWVRNNDRKTYAYLYSGKIHGPNISLGNESSKGDPLAFSLTEKGDEPVVQLRAGDKLKFISGETLLKKADEAKQPATDSADDMIEDAAEDSGPAETVRVKCGRRRCRPASSGSCSSNSGGCSSCSTPANATLPAPATAGVSASGCGSCANPANNVGSVRYLGPVPSNQSPRP